VLHVPSGTVEHGVTVDRVRDASRRPRVVADAAALPFPDASFDLVLSDPPYSREDSERYGCPPYPLKAAMAEARRVLRPGGFLGVLHTYYPPYRRGEWEHRALIAVVTGPLRATRVFSVFRKPVPGPQAALWGEGDGDLARVSGTLREHPRPGSNSDGAVAEVPETAPTQRGYGHGAQGQHNDDAAGMMLVRRLTPVECERLQGFPDGWTAEAGGEPFSDTTRYRMLGNAVTVSVARWIARRLREAHLRRGLHLPGPWPFAPFEAPGRPPAEEEGEAPHLPEQPELL
jgi:SAM-dependent methyltransferase